MNRDHERDERLFLACILMAAAVSLTWLFLQGCSSWQGTTRKVLVSVSAAARQVPEAAKLACEVVTARCIDEARNPCPALDRCRDVGRDAIKGATAAQAAVLVGLAAVDVGDKPSAERALVQAIALIEPIRSTLAAFGVALPKVQQ